MSWILPQDRFFWELGWYKLKWWLRYGDGYMGGGVEGEEDTMVMVFSTSPKTTRHFLVHRVVSSPDFPRVFRSRVVQRAESGVMGEGGLQRGKLRFDVSENFLFGLYQSGMSCPGRWRVSLTEVLTVICYEGDSYPVMDWLR